MTNKNHCNCYLDVSRNGAPITAVCAHAQQTGLARQMLQQSLGEEISSGIGRSTGQHARIVYQLHHLTSNQLKINTGIKSTRKLSVYQQLETLSSCVTSIWRPTLVLPWTIQCEPNNPVLWPSKGQCMPRSCYSYDIDRHTHTQTILQLFGLCPGQPGWASTRR